MDFYVAGSNASQTLCLSQDVAELEIRLKSFMEKQYKDVKYKDFYDKKFLDIIKGIIKQPEEFKLFLKYIHCDLNDFITASVYVCPSIFTTATVKFIKCNYLNNTNKKDHDLENTNN